MTRPNPASTLCVFLALVSAPAVLAGQGTLEDYRRAATLEERYQGLVVHTIDDAWWSEESGAFVLRRSVADGHEFISLDPRTGDETVIAEPERPSPRGFGGGGDVGRSPDGRFEVVAEGHNIVVRRTLPEGEGEEIYRTRDGTEGNAYQLRTVRWSPASDRFVIHRVEPGHERLIHFIETAPPDQVQPRLHTFEYTKPGDRLDRRQPVLIDPVGGTALDIDDRLFRDAYSLSVPQWNGDGRSFTFEYNARGHGRYRVIRVDAATGEPRTLIDENPETFFYYRPSRQSGKYFRHDLEDGRIVWMSERDGWNHLYLHDGETGDEIRQITRGEWVVRDVDHVDEERGEIVFAASGMDPERDPYFVHYYRIGLDGSGLAPLTEADGDHQVLFSPDRSVYLDTWSRLDLPPVTQLRRASDGAVLAEPGRGDHSALLAAGWRPPEVFWAMGRDGRTPIRGIIQRPSNFTVDRRWPVVESIYAGPHDFHVPTAFTPVLPRGMAEVAELGFVTVMIDGMGTSGRSKAFHDVAWKNLADAGFPDRIAWHQSVAEQYDWYDIDRVGIYGGSAGGQNAMAALLFHPEFYHVAVAHNGCHDNRMDKIWWNELWMGWPVDETYDASSNVVHAHRLQGSLLLTLGEMDTNVDPASTYQVVDALVRAGKDFDFFVVPGGGHARGWEHIRKRWDFLVEEILGVPSPDWNRVSL